MNICIIPARGGSKRITKKNIKKFNGIPIIAYSIKAAIDSYCFDKVIVSTDSEEIASLSRHYGAEVPFIRPQELSDDYIETIPVIKHAIEWFEENNFSIKYACCLYATAPFIQPKVISDAYEQLIDSQAYYCFSVTSFPFPIQRSIKITSKNRLNMFYPEHFDSRSQDLEEAYHDAGQFYWGHSDAFKEELPIFSELATPYLLPRFLVQDIDSIEDWIRAEAMHQVLLKTKILPKVFA
jgi:pseudaminic acid cytidylyltransferase